MMNKVKKAKNITQISLWVTILLIGIYLIFRVVANDKDELDSRYVFLATQTFSLLLLSILPVFIERKWLVDLPDTLEIMFLFFLIGSVLVGEIGGLYAKTRWWDAIMHGFSGGLIAITGFSIANLLNNDNFINLKLTPLFMSIFVFCFASTIGVIWEIIEFSNDYFTGGNMQRHFDDINNVPFVGIDALKDTMQDFMINSIGALTASIIGYVNLKLHNNKFESLFIDRSDIKYSLTIKKTAKAKKILCQIHSKEIKERKKQNKQIISKK